MVQIDVFFMSDKNTKAEYKHGVYALHVNSWGNVYVMRYYQFILC